MTVPTPAAAWPDAEDTVMTLLESVAPTVQSTPAEWTPPLIQVRQVGGTNDKFSDRPVIEVACFGSDYGQAKQLAADCRQLLLATSGRRVSGVTGYPNGVLLDKVTAATSPREVTYQDPERRRKTATYQLTLRRPRS